MMWLHKRYSAILSNMGWSGPPVDLGHLKSMIYISTSMPSTRTNNSLVLASESSLNSFLDWLVLCSPLFEATIFLFFVIFSRWFLRLWRRWLKYLATHWRETFDLIYGFLYTAVACCSLASLPVLSRSLGHVMVVVGNVGEIWWPSSTGGPDRPALTYALCIPNLV